MEKKYDDTLQVVASLFSAIRRDLEKYGLPKRFIEKFLDLFAYEFDKDIQEILEKSRREESKFKLPPNCS